MFELTKDEFENWRCQFGTSNADKMGLRYRPMAFTEHGILMLSSVLNSKRAILVNIQIMRAFTKLRKILVSNEELRVTIQVKEFTTQDTKKQRFTVTTCSYIGQKKLRNTRKTAKINNQKEFVDQNFSRFLRFS